MSNILGIIRLLVGTAKLIPLHADLVPLLTAIKEELENPQPDKPAVQGSELRESYNASLLKLAPIDPLSAYRLRGQADVMQRLPMMVQALQVAGAKHLDMDSSKSPPPELVTFFQQYMEADDVLSTRTTVREVIQRIARLLDRRTRRELADTLEPDTFPNEDELDEMMSEYIEKMREAIPELFQRAQ